MKRNAFLSLTPFLAAAVAVAQSSTPDAAQAPQQPAKPAQPAKIATAPTAPKAPRATLTKATAPVLGRVAPSVQPQNVKVEVEVPKAASPAPAVTVTVEGKDIRVTQPANQPAKLTARDGVLTQSGETPAEVHFGELILSTEKPQAPQATPSSPPMLRPVPTIQDVFDRTMRAAPAPSALRPTRQDDESFESKVDRLEDRFRQIEALLHKALGDDAGAAVAPSKSVSGAPKSSSLGTTILGKLNGAPNKKVEVIRTKVVDENGENVDARVWVNGEEIDVEGLSGSIVTLGENLGGSIVKLEELEGPLVSLGDGLSGSLLKLGEELEGSIAIGGLSGLGETIEIALGDGHEPVAIGGLGLAPQSKVIIKGDAEAKISGDGGTFSIDGGTISINGQDITIVDGTDLDTHSGVVIDGLGKTVDLHDGGKILFKSQVGENISATVTEDESGHIIVKTAPNVASGKLPSGIQVQRPKPAVKRGTAIAPGNARAEWDQMMREMRSEVEELRAAMRELRGELRSMREQSTPH